MVALGRGVDFDGQHAVLHLDGIDGSSRRAGHFVTRGNIQFELHGFSLNDGDIGEHGQADIGLADGNKRFHAGEKTHFARNRRCDDFSRSPPDVGGLAWHEGRFDDGLAVRRRLAGN